jgi:dTDP-4-dehydrorhamnose 3,5-epimerase
MEVLETNLKNVLLFKPFIHQDFRGEYVELYKEKDYTKSILEKTGKEVRFVEEDMSTSFKNVLRGIHGDDKTWKLIDCLKGNIYVVAVNCDEENKDFGKWQSFSLSDRNRMQILIPPKHGTAHLVLSDEAYFHYRQSEYYHPDTLKQFTYSWNDKNFNIWWPIREPILSKRDSIKD